MPELSHFDERGASRMVDVGGKPETERTARASGIVRMAAATVAFIKDRKLRSCLIWAHAHNNACFFYEAMGGRRVATRTTRLLGELTPEIGFGWKRLATRKQARSIQSRSDPA